MLTWLGTEVGMASTGRHLREEGGSLDRFAGRCAAACGALYRSMVRTDPSIPCDCACSLAMQHVVRAIAVLTAAERMPQTRQARDPLSHAADVLRHAACAGSTGAALQFEESCHSAAELSGFGVFASDSEHPMSDDDLRAMAEVLLGPHPDAPIEPIFFQSMPVSWLGHVYQRLLAYRPDASGAGLKAGGSHRKSRGVFFTPPSLVTYIVESVLAALADDRKTPLGAAAVASRPMPRVLDPAMGGGDFLCRAVDLICDGVSPAGSADDAGLRAGVAAECCYGVDIDPVAVDIARFGVWAASGFAEGIAGKVCSHLIRADALAAEGGEGAFDWRSAFPDVLGGGPSSGFDAVVGNPPYIAVKNGLGNGRRVSGSGQADSYLLFLSMVMDGGLVKPGGMLAMVLPDPMLVRANAAKIRRRLAEEWTITSLLHILGAFPEAEVSNIVPVCRNAVAAGGVFQSSRIERAADRRSFALRPHTTARAFSRPVRRETVLAQPRCEMLYLLEEGSFGEIIRRIHGENVALATYLSPFVPLRSLNVKCIYRGEEIGKSAIKGETGDMPMLLGGQSVQPYEVTWEGRRIDLAKVRKSLNRYQGTKILLQKSSARIVAALDEVSGRHPGYVFPQSVYGIELRQPGIHELYLLCVLNSEVMNEYIRRTVTGYKMLQPQIELEDVRALPIRSIGFTTPHTERQVELARGMEIFERESIRAGEGVPFPELANFATHCLAGAPERSDVVHDLLVELGRLVVDLTASNRSAPDPASVQRLESARRAIESIVWRLYSSEPAQMALPF